MTAAWLVAVALPLVEVGSASSSDGLALALAGCAFCEVTRVRWPGALASSRSVRAFAIAGALLGLALGVRPSYAPLVTSFAVLLWLLPLVAIVGPRLFVSLGV